jgi:hypothetical protein
MTWFCRITWACFLPEELSEFRFFLLGFWSILFFWVMRLEKSRDKNEDGVVLAGFGFFMVWFLKCLLELFLISENWNKIFLWSGLRSIFIFFWFQHLPCNRQRYHSSFYSQKTTPNVKVEKTACCLAIRLLVQTQCYVIILEFYLDKKRCLQFTVGGILFSCLLSVAVSMLVHFSC